MNQEKLKAAVDDAFADEPELGYRPFVIAVYSLKDGGAGRLGEKATGRIEVFLRPTIKHGHMVVYDTAKALFQWLKAELAK
jgi:hypothetical protein